MIELASLSFDDAIDIIEATQLVYWNQVRYQERTSDGQDRLKSFDDVRVFPIRKQLKVAEGEIVPDSAILLKSLVKQDHEPEHLLLQLKGRLVKTTADTEEIRASLLNPTRLYHLYGQPRISQVAREVTPAMSSLASKGIFLCITRGFKAFLWIGEYFASLYGAAIRINESSTILSEGLLKRIIHGYCKVKNMDYPTKIPEVHIMLEGKENPKAMELLGRPTFIKNELKYSKEVLDYRDSLYYDMTQESSFTFEEDNKSYSSIKEDSKDLMIMDTNKEIFLLIGDKLVKEERRAKFKTVVKAFFSAKKSKSMIQKVTITLISAKSKIYAALKYLTI